MKKHLAVLCACILALVLLSACADGDNSPASSLVSSDPVTTAINNQTQSSSDESSGSAGSSVTTASASSSNGSSATGSTNTSSHSGSKPTTSAVSTAPPSGSDFSVELVQYHPGVPGYNVSYTLVLYDEASVIPASDATFSCNRAGVTYSGNTVTVPESVRNAYADFTVTAVRKSDGKKDTLVVPCKKWTQSFNDDFDGNTLSDDKWSVFEAGVDHGSTHETTTNDCWDVKDGKLALKVEKRNVTVNGKTYAHAGAAIATNQNFSQLGVGCFSASMKLPSQGGLNSAFWLMPMGSWGKNGAFFDSLSPSKECGEVDIIEMSANWGDKYQITEHYFDFKNNYNHTMKTGYGKTSNATTQFNTYSCAVVPGQGIYYYCNGNLVWSNTQVAAKSTPNNVLARPMFMLLSLHLGNPSSTTWLGKWTFPDVESSFPINMYVDWVRAYK